MQQKTTWQAQEPAVCTVLELGPFNHLTEETGFSERNCYLKCSNRGWEIAVHPCADKKVNRKVQGVPQSQTAANPRHQEEEKNDKN